MALSVDDKKEIAANLDDSIAKAIAALRDEFGSRITALESRPASGELLDQVVDEATLPALSEAEVTAAVNYCITKYPGHQGHVVKGHEIVAFTIPANQLAKFSLRRMLKEAKVGAKA